MNVDAVAFVGLPGEYVVVVAVGCDRDGRQRMVTSPLVRAIAASIVDTVFLVDLDLRVCFVSRSWRGMSIETLIGQDIGALLPAAARAGLIAQLRDVLATGETATHEFDAPSLAGEMQYLEIRAARVREDGRGAGLCITVRDISERKHLEQEIVAVSSRERQAIGRDLHDGLGQELTGVALMLRGLAMRIQQQCPEAVDQVNEIVTLVNQSIEAARGLAHGLLPVDTGAGGLAGALRALAERSRTAFGFAVECRVEVSPEIALTATRASHLYRIAQEALTNAARHAHASVVAVTLRVTRTQFALEITDDGGGVRETARSTSGMGLRIMKYRAGMIGARFEILACRPRGTLVRVTGEHSAVPSTLHSGHAL